MLEHPATRYRPLARAGVSEARPLARSDAVALRGQVPALGRFSIEREHDQPERLLHCRSGRFRLAVRPCHPRPRLQQPRPQAVTRVVGVIRPIRVQGLDCGVVQRTLCPANELGGPRLVALLELQPDQLDPCDEQEVDDYQAVVEVAGVRLPPGDNRL
jgi:hypothetical protein